VELRYVCFYGETCSTSQARRAWSLFLQVKHDQASRLKCTATLIIDYIQYSRKSCHDEYEFRTGFSFTISCWNYIFITRNYNTYNCNFPISTNRLLYYPSLRSIQFTTQDLRGHVTSPDQGLSSTRGKRLGTRLGIKLLILANKLSFIRKTKSVTYLFYFIIISMN
jgi:hypothetical protein